MTLQIKSPISKTVQDLLSNPSLQLDMEQYDKCVTELRGIHQRKATRGFVVMTFLFALGLVAVGSGLTFWAVLLLIIADNSNRKSSHHMLADEILAYQRMLAMVINQQGHRVGTGGVPPVDRV